MVWVLFTRFGTCLPSSTGFPVVSNFLTFEVPQGSWDILLNSLKTIADLHLFWSSGLIKCRMLVWIRCSPFLIEILFIFVTLCFPWADAISSSVTNANSLLLKIPLEVLSFACGYTLHLVVWNVFIFNVFCLSPVVYFDKQVTIPCFLNCFQTSSCRYYFFYEERWEFGLADLLQRFNNNESGEVCSLILRV